MTFADVATRRRDVRGVVVVAASCATLALVGCPASEAEPPFDDARAVTLTVGGRGDRPGRMLLPRAVTVDRSTGDFWVVDRNGRVQLFSPDGRLRAHFLMPDTARGQPVGLEWEAGGTLLVSDTHYQRVRRYRPDLASDRPDDPVELEPGAMEVDSFGAEGEGPGDFTWARDVVRGPGGHLFVGDTGGLNDRVEKFTADGDFVLEWGRRGTAPGEFDHPAGMAIERRPEGVFLLVADLNNHRIQRFDLDGRFVSAWGSLGTEPGRLRFPRSVVVTETGDILVCEWGNNRVQRFDSEGTSLGVWGRAGHGVGELLTPWDLELGPDGLVHVCDYGNHRVQVFRWPEGEEVGSS